MKSIKCANVHYCGLCSALYRQRGLAYAAAVAFAIAIAIGMLNAILSSCWN